jgi:hypothetical protein
MCRCFYAFAFVLIVSALASCEEPEKITVCKLKNDPAAYNHKLVEMEGFLSRGFEDFTLSDPNCPYSPEIWLEYGGKVASGTVYCCGPSNNRTRQEQLMVDAISIPLVDDERFLQFDKLIHDQADTVVHATIRGRFFAGERSKGADKPGNWGGYGHMGCCSLLAIEQVVSFDPHHRSDLDYRASPDQPDLARLKCGTLENIEVPSVRATFDIQHNSEAGIGVSIFDDPRRVALDFLAQNLRIDESTIKGMGEKSGQGRRVYEWRSTGKPETYVVVVSRPYWLSFYAETESRVAWIVIAAYRACGD